MSLVERMKNLPRKHLAIGIVGGLLVSVFALFLLNSLILGYPTSPEVYQYEYPKGTNPVSPITQDSVQIHASGVALSNAAYQVDYSGHTYYIAENGSKTTINKASIEYSINNKGGVGYLERSLVTTGAIGKSSNQTLSIYENNSTAFIRNEVKNSTHWQETGVEPLVLSNQLELPKNLVTAVPHIKWEPVDQRTIDGVKYIVYKPTGASASQMKYIETVTKANGKLLVNTKTSVITYSVTVTGTRTLQSGETVTVKKTQSLSYKPLANSSIPPRPDWAQKSESSNDDSSDSTWNTSA